MIAFFSVRVNKGNVIGLWLQYGEWVGLTKRAADLFAYLSADSLFTSTEHRAFVLSEDMKIKRFTTPVKILEI